ncbi:very short patch repair endonuclease [Micromonospora arborensis]|uniref:Very short patch repair endonuclease n=2 Tax=Micromonospora arborensis TaxID=2116518 RepID=A0A318NEH6_9ACTN|nr:very short patch repair endonuclease [Micromonospora arborensis]PYC66637.1 very short patch repair endonuclease [Micromonospora arborensis]
MSNRSWASTPAVRRSMQSNRSRDTKPELLLRRALHARGLRYRVCTKPLPDLRMKADIVFRPARVAVEVRGCFWHGCPEHHRKPTANSEYWTAKISRNIARDRKNEKLLSEAGWLLIAVWEHEGPADSAALIAEVVGRRRGGSP